MCDMSAIRVNFFAKFLALEQRIVKEIMNEYTAKFNTVLI